MARTKKIIIKTWDLLLEDEKNNLEYLDKLKKGYEKQVTSFQSDKNYVRIANQIYKLNTSKTKSILAEAKALEEQKRSEEKRQAAQIAQLESEKSLQEIINEYDFYMNGAGILYWFYRPTKTDKYGIRPWKVIKKETLLANFPATNVFIRATEKGQPDYSSFKEFCGMLIDQGRTFTDVCQSYKSVLPGQINIMTTNFCKESEDGSTDYHWFFDAVLESVSGGKAGDKETFEHLQEIIYGKWLHPENIFGPNVICNDDGATGKGLMVHKILPTLFSGSVVENGNINHLTGKFNGLIAGKAIIVVNETAKDTVDDNRVKAFMGSPTFVVENKFETPYVCDNTSLVIMFSNNKDGGIRLAGTHADRRYSIFSSKYNIYKITKEYMLKYENKDVAESECKDWIIDVGQHILEDRTQVGKWLSAMKIKFGDLIHIHANMGKAYKNMVDRQRPGWLDTVETVFTEPGFVCIREQMLRDLVKEYNKCERFIPGKKRFNEEVEKLILDKNLPIELAHNANLYPQKGTINAVNVPFRRTLWRVIGVKCTQDDEKMFGEVDQNGRFIWKFMG